MIFSIRVWWGRTWERHRYHNLVWICCFCWMYRNFTTELQLSYKWITIELCLSYDWVAWIFNQGLIKEDLGETQIQYLPEAGKWRADFYYIISYVSWGRKCIFSAQRGGDSTSNQNNKKHLIEDTDTIF